MKIIFLWVICISKNSNGPLSPVTTPPTTLQSKVSFKNFSFIESELLSIQQAGFDSLCLGLEKSIEDYRTHWNLFVKTVR